MAVRISKIIAWTSHRERAEGEVIDAAQGSLRKLWRRRTEPSEKDRQECAVQSRGGKAFHTREQHIQGQKALSRQIAERNALQVGCMGGRKQAGKASRAKPDLAMTFRQRPNCLGG